MDFIDSYDNDGNVVRTYVCDACGKPVNSFACKIRHVQVNTGDAKAAND